MKSKYKFSVVIPVYNVEKYLEETILSVINQTIGFKENIQIILVNDGSPDNSGKICQKYADAYPDNIVYTVQKNAGVSAARNTGIQFVKGELVNFLDSDDCWEKDSFEHIYRFAKKAGKKTDVIAARKQFFDARTGYHILDYKFKKTRLVNLITDYEFIQLDVTGAFIRAEAIGEQRFLSNLKYGEDAQFVNSIILKKCTLGIVREAVHLYRKRQDESSALQNELKSHSYYFDSPKYFHQNLFKQSNEKYGKIIPYIQYVVMYDLHWRIAKHAYELLNKEDLKEYKSQIVSELKQIDDNIILQQPNLSPTMKIYALNLKYGKDIRHDLKYDHARVMFNNLTIVNFLYYRYFLNLHFVDILNDTLYLEGSITPLFPEEDYSFCAVLNDKSYQPALYDLPRNDVNGIDKGIFKGKGFKIEIPLQKNKELNIYFLLNYKGMYTKKIFATPGKFGHIPAEMNDRGYYHKGDYILKFSKKILKVIPNKFLRRVKYELLYWKELKKAGKAYLIKWRAAYFVLHPFYKDKIWLISDRVNKANDNGEHLFKYICSVKDKSVKPYYVINKSSEDYEKMKKIGPVIPFGSIKYRLFFLLSSKIASSSGNEYVISAFGNDRNYLSDLYNFDYIFLQHGVTKDDLSGWVNKYNKNIKALVTAGRPEYQSFVDGDYYYTPDIPILSGFPRHDNLMRMQKASEKKPEKKILLIPTWRKTITGSFNPSTGESVYFDGFKDTDYFRFYNSLIKNERLLDCMRKHGYTGLFCMHPSHAKQYVDFEQNDVFKINEGYVDYQKEFAQCSLLITDYSSVFFDFAYLKKPVVYSQFDKEEFFAGEHAYKKGYFSYENDGFGPVCYDLESTVDAIIESIENDCKISGKYLKNVEAFYPYFDENSCKRVYEYIKKIPR